MQTSLEFDQRKSYLNFQLSRIMLLVGNVGVNIWIVKNFIRIVSTLNHTLRFINNINSSTSQGLLKALTIYQLLNRVFGKPLYRKGRSFAKKKELRNAQNYKF